jgi:hypothetical protein
METVEDVTRMRLVGGNLALDFINTRAGPPVGAPDDDVLTGYPGLVAWGVYAGALTEAEAAALSRLARHDPGDARAAFTRSLSIRDNLDGVFRALAAGRRPSSSGLTRLRDDEADALGHAAGGARGGPPSHDRGAGPDQGMRRLSVPLQR